MKLVIIESPYGSDDPEVVAANVQYARECMYDCLVVHGEAPFASHLLYTQPGVLNDRQSDDRRLGIAAGLAWGEEAQATVVYTDRGLSEGMQEGISRAAKDGREVVFRKLPNYQEAHNDGT